VWKLIGRRLLLAAATMFSATLAIFIAVRALPANPVLARFGQHAVPEKIEEEMASQGWNEPILMQFGSFLVQLSRGDLGESFATPAENVADRLSQALPATIELTLAAMFIALPLGIGSGVLAALWRNRWPDWLSMGAALLGVSVPVFFLAICLILLFPTMPTGSRFPAFSTHQFYTEFYFFESLLTADWGSLKLALRHLILPAVALSTIPTAVISRITRNSMLEVLSTDYLRTARAKGAGRWRVVWRHAFPNASLSVLNIAGFQLGLLLTGAVLTETVFNWPGMGTYVVQGIQDYDYAVVQGCALVMAAMFVLLNLAIDVLFVVLDPRLRKGGQA